MPLPEHYDDFDPEAHDLEMERLEALMHQHWLADLRNLESETDAARKERQQKPGSYRESRAAFEAEDPPPDRKDYEARAAWEWRWQERVYTEMGSEHLLKRHHLERGSFIERRARMLREVEERVEEEFLKPLQELARKRKPFVPKPWPVGDGFSRWRARLDAVMDPEEVEEEMTARDEPSYVWAKNLRAALLGWWQSLPEEAREFASPLHHLAERAGSSVCLAFKPEYMPANIGSAMHQLWTGIGQAQDVLDMLDDHAGEWWLRPEAQARLVELVETLRDAALERYAVLQGYYDGYLERAERLLGGTKWTPPPSGKLGESS